jgi:hypothetical protein
MATRIPDPRRDHPCWRTTRRPDSGVLVGPVTTLLAGVSLAGMSPAMTVEGGTDTAVFAGCLEHFLLLALSPGMVVVVDNVGAHHPDRIRELVAAPGWFTHAGYPTRQAA